MNTKYSNTKLYGGNSSLILNFMFTNTVLDINILLCWCVCVCIGT
nr:MAG TPA: hypothetical protein [Caudoviricetes sp.]